MRVLIIAGMIDAKLVSKVAPLLEVEQITQIHLSRRKRYQHDRIRCHSPPQWLCRIMPLAEAWRVFNLLYLCLRFRPALLIALGTVPHGLYAWMLGRLFRIPVIQHVMGKNDLRLTFDKALGKKLTLRAVCAAAAVGVRGRASLDYLRRQGVPANKLFKPQNLHDFSLFKPDSHSKPVYDLIYVGLLSPYKRIDLLLESLHLARQRLPQLRLLLVGDGPLRGRLQTQARQLDLIDAACFAGSVDYAQLPSCFRRAKVFIMTSQGEGLPMAMIEAMSCGLPAIIADDADIGEVARHEYNSLVVETWTPAAFAAAIVRLLSDTALYQQLRRGALALREHKREEYSLHAQARLWAKTIDTVLKSRD